MPFNYYTADASKQKRGYDQFVHLALTWDSTVYVKNAEFAIFLKYSIKILLNSPLTSLTPYPTLFLLSDKSQDFYIFTMLKV